MSKQPKEISIDWPPEKGRIIIYSARENLDYIIPLVSNKEREENSI